MLGTEHIKMNKTKFPCPQRVGGRMVYGEAKVSSQFHMISGNTGEFKKLYFICTF